MPTPPAEPTKTVQKVIDDLGLYPPEAFQFLQEGLSFTVDRIHGRRTTKAKGLKKGRPLREEEAASRHIGGMDLCLGLRDYALLRWGMMAGVVLRRWNVTSTFDFGRMVFALVDNDLMQKTDKDSIDDFRNVFDFSAAFDGPYQIESPKPAESPA